MIALLLVGALVLGMIAARIGLPPLVGFLASGFLFGALGMDGTPLLEDLADGGVLLLLFAVGLKLRIKTLLRFEVWGTATSHLLLTGIVGGGIAFAASGLPGITSKPPSIPPPGCSANCMMTAMSFAPSPVTSTTRAWKGSDAPGSAVL